MASHMVGFKAVEVSHKVVPCHLLCLPLPLLNSVALQGAMCTKRLIGTVLGPSPPINSVKFPDDPLISRYATTIKDTHIF